MTGKISHRVDWKYGAGLGFISAWNKALKLDCQEYVRLIIFIVPFFLINIYRSERDISNFLSILHTANKYPDLKAL